MDRLFAKNVIALSGRAIEASGDVDILLLDKTGTITLGDRQAVNLFRLVAFARGTFQCSTICIPDG